MSFCTLYGFRRFRIRTLESMAGTTGLEPATSAVTECIGYKNHRVTAHFTALRGAINSFESTGANAMYLRLYL
jgi:hypothetical protein